MYCVVVTDLIERTELLHKQGGISNILTGKNCANSKIICNEIICRICLMINGIK